MQRAPSLSSKNPTPNWLANNGIYSIIASLTLQCLSSASSTMAGNKDWESRSIPMTYKNGLFQQDLRKKTNAMHVKITCTIVKSTYSIIRKETWNAHKRKKIKNQMFIFKILTDLIHLIKLANNIKAYIRKFILQKRKENWKELFNCGILH